MCRVSAPLRAPNDQLKNFEFVVVASRVSVDDF